MQTNATPNSKYEAIKQHRSITQQTKTSTVQQQIEQQHLTNTQQPLYTTAQKPIVEQQQFNNNTPTKQQHSPTTNIN